MWVEVADGVWEAGGWRWKKHTLSHLFTYPGELTSDMESGAAGVKGEGLESK